MNNPHLEVIKLRLEFLYRFESTMSDKEARSFLFGKAIGLIDGLYAADAITSSEYDLLSCLVSNVLFYSRRVE